MTELSWKDPFIRVVDGVLTAEECGALIGRIEALGPSEAPITTSRGFEHRPEIRNNTRVMFDDAALAARLFEKVRAIVPPEVEGMRPVGANERLRCYRYAPGQYFAPHFDGSFVRGPKEKSVLTLMVYLNEPEAGGETHFGDADTVVRPRTGLALLFDHHLLHESRTLRRGVKYAVRSDVMYRRD
jgi:predicted 2-oxoglutarate/Fe(II)-dependent dioxygenase YbiX